MNQNFKIPKIIRTFKSQVAVTTSKMEEDKNETIGDRSIIDTQCLLGNIDAVLDNLQPQVAIGEAPDPHIESETVQTSVSVIKPVEQTTDSVIQTTQTDETINKCVESQISSNSSEIDQSTNNQDESSSKLLETSELTNVSSVADEVKSSFVSQETTSSFTSIDSNTNTATDISSQDSSFITHSGKVISQESKSLSQSLELFSQQTTSQTTVESNQESKDIEINVSKRKLSNESEEEETSKKCKISEDQPVEEEINNGNEEQIDEQDCSYQINYNFEKEPGQITGAWEEFKDKESNFIKGCKWSPDGSCILSNSDDNTLRLFNTPPEIYNGSLLDVPEMKSVLKMKVGETIYDYCWYPLMNSSDPESCCLISTSRCMPVHMWDAFTSELICSYKSYDQADELVAAHSVAFNNEGNKIYCGFTKTIRVFDVSRPGRDFHNRKTFVKSVGQPGIISCIKFSPVDNSLYAAGSYSRTIALYYEPQGELACSFTGHQGGVTHILWSPDGTKLYSGARKDGEIICWDLRNPSKILFTVNRQVETNQRIYFDLDSSGRYLISGNHNGTVNVWDVLQIEDTRPKPILSYKAHYDTVNGVSFHPFLPVVATSSGQRHYPVLGDSDDSDTEDLSQTTDLVDNSIGLWWLSS